jgi:ubiquinone/menaquinone biosynthesis C-methylase UbiE
MAETELDTWEAAYARFETPEQEIEKFTKRLLKLGAGEWPRSAAIVELFCGRGNGLVALTNLGFSNLTGVDYSPALLNLYQGPAQCVVGDCRSIPIEDNSQDFAIVQGGLHHLLKIPEDLDLAVADAKRILKKNGKFIVVEPWQTSFLQVVHGACGISLVRKLSSKTDALATMIENEKDTYFNWLSRPDEVLQVFEKHFRINLKHVGFGKIMIVAEKI